LVGVVAAAGLSGGDKEEEGDEEAERGPTLLGRGVIRAGRGVLGRNSPPLSGSVLITPFL
jgi:hypothetical protein